MRRLREWVSRLAGTVRPRRSDEDLREELDLHLQMEAERARQQGVSSDEARRAAAIRAGGVAQAMEHVRDRRGMPWVADLWRDLRYGVRGLAREPSFALVAIVSLGLGIGVNAAIFSLVDAVLLRTLPVQRPSELVFIETAGSSGRGGAPPYPCFERFRRETSAFVGLAAFATDQLKIEVDGGVEQVFGQAASGNYFELLGIKPVIGRLMSPDDERLDPAAAVIGYGYWQRRFGGNVDVIGRPLKFRDRTYTIVGVTPPGFWGLEPGRRVDVTLPITLEREHLADAGDWWFEAVGRLRGNSSAAQAAAQLDAVFQSFMKDRGTSGMRAKYFDHMQVTPAARGTGGLRTRFARPLYGVTVVAALVLLIACASLASLLLVRGAGRRHEFAIRLATGASVGRLFRQLFTEAALLFLCGAALGLALAPAAIKGLTGFFAVGRNPILLDVRVDWKLAAFAMGIAFVTALGTALWPALHALRADPESALSGAANRVAGSRRTASATRVLVISQIAIAFVLLVAAVLSVRTVVNLRGVDLGFSPARVITMSLDPAFPPDAGGAAYEEFWTAVLNRVRSLRGVDAASLSVLTPLSGRDRARVVDAASLRSTGEAERIVHVNDVSEDYFRTFGIAVHQGRVFTAHDDSAAARVVVLNEAAAKAYFPGKTPIGESIRFGPGQSYRIIGVVGDHKHMSLREPAPRFAFVPLWQPERGSSRITLSVLSGEPSGSLLREIAREVRTIHAETLISDVIDVNGQIDATLVSERLMSVLAFAFAALALGLAAIGVYGVLSYSVARRRPEFGIRMALGASPADVAAHVIGHVLVELAVGTAIGLPLALFAARLARGLLFGVTAADMSSYVAGASILMTAACAAAALPAWRAWSIDPSDALRRG
jgi:predicted permease